MEKSAAYYIRARAIVGQIRYLFIFHKNISSDSLLVFYCEADNILMSSHICRLPYGALNLVLKASLIKDSIHIKSIIFIGEKAVQIFLARKGSA